MSVIKMKKILQQGHLDGFCLLYAVANAFKALKYPTKTANWFVEYQQELVWEKLVMVTPSLHNFASGIGSYFGTSDQTGEILHEQFLGLCAATISENESESFSVNRITFEDISEAVTKNSVVILCLRKEVRTNRCSIGDHWVCVVDIDDKDFKLACSYSEYLPNFTQWKSLDEEVSNGYKRPFNSAIAKKKLNNELVFENLVFRFNMICN